jgi:hypothetical protein
MEGQAAGDRAAKPFRGRNRANRERPGAAPAGGFVARPREASGRRPPGTKTGCLEWLDAARMKGGETCPDRGGLRPPVRARKHGPGACIAGAIGPRCDAAVERREAPAWPLQAARQDGDGRAFRRSAPSHFVRARKGTTAYPGPQRMRVVTHARLRAAAFVRRRTSAAKRLRRAAFAIDGLPAEAAKERRLAYPAPLKNRGNDARQCAFSRRPRESGDPVFPVIEMNRMRWRLLDRPLSRAMTAETGSGRTQAFAANRSTLPSPRAALGA